MSKHLKGDNAYLKFYQLLSDIKTLLGHKRKGDIIKRENRTQNEGSLNMR